MSSIITIIAIAVGLLSIPLMVYVFMCAAVVMAINHMKNAASTVHPKQTIDNPPFMEWYRRTDVWATNHGFQRSYLFDVENMKPPPINCALWTNAKTKEVIALYYHNEPGHHYDVVTMYSNQQVLTTGSSKDGAMLPTPPNKHTQIFPNHGLEELYRQHQKARQVMERQRRLVPLVPPQNIMQVVVDDMQRQIDYVRSIPLWQLRGPFWYFIRKQTHSNKPIT